MDSEFWFERWAHQQIGFHQPDGHPMLARHWPALALAPGTRVLVPLCGKTPDLCWLANAGHAVTGIELSARATRDFFAEQQLEPAIDRLGPFVRYRSGNIRILVGDFFDATTRELGVFDGFYDRAALIALPDAMRADYVDTLRGLLGADARGLLITLEYDQSEMRGPPFSVPESEVARHLDTLSPRQIADVDAIGPDGILAGRRATAAREKTYTVGV